MPMVKPSRRVHPNHWRAERHDTPYVRFENLSRKSVVTIYTVGGERRTFALLRPAGDGNAQRPQAVYVGGAGAVVAVMPTSVLLLEPDPFEPGAM